MTPPPRPGVMGRSKHCFTTAEYALERLGQRAFYPVAVTGDFKKAFLQVRVGPEERDALICYCLIDGGFSERTIVNITCIHSSV